MEVVTQAGIEWKLVRVWAGDRGLERRLKRRKNTPRRLCPVCMGLVAYDAVDEPGVLPTSAEHGGGGDTHWLSRGCAGRPYASQADRDAVNPTEPCDDR